MPVSSAERNRRYRMNKGMNVNPPGVRGRPRKLLTEEEIASSKEYRKQYQRDYYQNVLKARRKRN